MRSFACLLLAATLAAVVACGDEDLQFGEEQNTPTPDDTSTPSTTATPTPTVTPEPTAAV